MGVAYSGTYARPCHVRVGLDDAYDCAIRIIHLLKCNARDVTSR
jgi:hypothetical protein